jgi:uncharacterized integral membrane protein
MTADQPPSERRSAESPPVDPTGRGGAGDDPLRGSRTSGVWIALAVLVLLIVLLAVFILQNTQRVSVSFLGWDGTAPLAATLLIATAAGMLVTVIAGSLRIWQLRRRVRRSSR